MKVILVKNVMGDDVIGICTTLENAKEKMIEVETEWLKMDEIDGDTFYDEVGKIKKAKTIDELNNSLEDMFFAQEFEVDG